MHSQSSSVDAIIHLVVLEDLGVGIVPVLVWHHVSFSMAVNPWLQLWIFIGWCLYSWVLQKWCFSHRNTSEFGWLWPKYCRACSMTIQSQLSPAVYFVSWVRLTVRFMYHCDEVTLLRGVLLHLMVTCILKTECLRTYFITRNYTVNSLCMDFI